MARNDRERRGQDVRSKPRHAANGNAAGGNGMHDGAARAGAEADEARRQACTALSHLFLRSDGWLRAIPTDDGKSLYLKWKFVRGKWDGHYVMALVEVWEWDRGIQLLLDKLEAVDVGARKPTHDRWYYAPLPPPEEPEDIKFG